MASYSHPSNPNRNRVSPSTAKQMAVRNQRVLARHSSEKVFQIPQRRLRNLCQRLLREESLMATDDHIVERCQPHQLIVLNDMTTVILVEQGALSFVDIKREPTQLMTLEGVNDGLCVDQPTTRRVDEHGVLFHLGERLLVYDVLGLISQRTVERDKVALGQQFVETGILAVRLEGIGRIGVVGHQLAAKALEDASKANTNLTSADDTDGFAVKCTTEQAIEVEVALAHAVVGSVRLAVERLDQSNGKLGDGFG